MDSSNKYDNNQKRAIIMKHYSTPDNKVASVADLPDWSQSYLHSSNCVDEITIAIKKSDNKVEDVKFSAVGCAVFLSSCDIFSNIIKNKTFDQIKDIITNYKNLIEQNQTEINEEIFGDLVIYKDVKTHLNRLECASLIYKVVQENLEKETN
ncbi:iron-sulfur cluster assembly scaffold protein [Mycoplasma procyoni]|uniref:iron-sulfur cluster assembly scaffold protein n=1 Tax=Mycoplasma procyoni TaxID=568784 RepID=UPI00197C96FB|nr:iron-sulfur cluster assembly scaffold protein [Mycoplasma procyoni]MBN3534686.1 iron-sulfur cluster assembly scaffold protein [Mycoplasma procyoni]